MRYEIMTADVLNHNGRIYPRDVVEEIMIAINEHDIFVTLDRNDGIVVPMERVVGLARDAEMKDGVLSARVEVKETPSAHIYNQMIDEGADLSLSIGGTGEVAPDGRIYGYTLVYAFIHGGKNA